MVNTKCKKCKKSYATYGLPSKIISHCAKCKENGMVKRIYNPCIVCEKTRSAFRKPGTTKNTHCAKCKEEGMVNKDKRKCIVCKITSATFSIDGKQRTHCGKCKTKEMKSVDKKCIVCKKIRPSYSIYGKSKTHCAKCRTENMITHQQLCIVCKYVRASFGFSNGKKTHCGTCKEEGMEVLTREKCEICNETFPSFGIPGDEKATRCMKCKTPEMINLTGKRCKSKFCDTIVTKKYDGYCIHCFANLFPDNPKTLLIHKNSKELKVVSHIANKFEGFIHDKPIYLDLQGGCCNTRRRIDLRKLIGNTMLCIEIDEDQHKRYKEDYEIKRYDNLFMDFSGKYIFIRYNPDKYKENSRNRNPIFKTRIKILEKEIEKQVKRIENEENSELLEIIYLFYST